MQVWLWVGFITLVLALLALDLFVVNRKDQVVSVRKAVMFTLFFATCGALFSVAVYYIYDANLWGYGERFVQSTFTMQADKAKIPLADRATWTPPANSEAALAAANPGKTAAVLYLTGWLIEYALSMDNIFVIALIFTYFRIPGKYQHRVLFWGIMGALILRGLMIGLGSGLVKEFHYILYFFGAFLVYTALKLAFGGENEYEPEKSPVFRIAKKIYPLTPNFDGHNFFTRINGARFATPLFLVLVMVEGTDVVFAVDSIPAIFSITQEPFIVFTSNIFAILGLRSLYFALAGAMRSFEYLKYSLAFVLAFVGVKMLLPGWADLAGWMNTKWNLTLPTPELKITPLWSLGIIAGSLALGVIASLLRKSPPEEPTKSAESGATHQSQEQKAS
ncbi:MAG: TerC family protein [Phycisphaerales bacterium]